MVRFKVIKGSHLLLVLSAILLAVVIGFILLNTNFTKNSISGENGASGFSYEAGTMAVLASKQFHSNDLNIEIISYPSVSENKNGQKILIYHTHNREAFLPDPEDPYIESDDFRTCDAQHNIIRVGAELADALRGFGYDVTHDTTDHESDTLDNAYLQSLATLENYSEEFDLCIDLHRDAFADGMKACIKGEDGTEYAQMMMLVGKAESYPDNQRPNYDGNRTFAQRLTSILNREVPDICRNLTIKNARYNQHIGTRSLLVEVGHNQNTMEQALNSVPVLAKCLNSTMRQFF